MALGKSAAVVIGSFDLGESDRVITFYSREYGKVRGVAKASRRMRSRFGGALELFTLGQLVFFDTGRSELVRVDHFDVLEPFAALRTDLEPLGQAAWVVECVPCAAQAPGATPISPAAVAALGRLRAARWEEALAQPLGRVETELRAALEAHMTRLIGQPTRTAKFLREVRRLSEVTGER